MQNCLSSGAGQRRVFAVDSNMAPGVARPQRSQQR